jgi:hypothetical protein
MIKKGHFPVQYAITQSFLGRLNHMERWIYRLNLQDDGGARCDPPEVKPLILKELGV